MFTKFINEVLIILANSALFCFYEHFLLHIYLQFYKIKKNYKINFFTYAIITNMLTIISKFYIVKA